MGRYASLNGVGVGNDGEWVVRGVRSKPKRREWGGDREG